MIINVYCSSCKVPVIFVRFQLIFNFLDIFSINTQRSNFLKIRPVWVELFHEVGRTDRRADRHDEASGRFSEFWEHA